MSDRVKPSILIVEGNGAAFDDLRTCLEGRFVLESAATCESAITVLHRARMPLPLSCSAVRWRI